ncbi:MAG: DUF1351 domain-containing protein [Gammaproteobacteria bacterium]|nr:DUF1351 domain-containing protein [Gammaproteobacteria bacterium]
MSKIIEVTQKPIIAYDLIKQKSEEVEAKIQSLNIEALEPSEDNLSLIKSTRAELNSEFKTLEEQRKMVKDIVLKDYNIFEEQYKKLIGSKFQDADKTLKTLVDTVTDEILQIKINGIVEYFNKVNNYDFIGFEDLQLKIIKSISDKKLKEEIDTYLSSIKQSLKTIETLQNKERVLAKFQMHKDLSRAISDTNLEVQREEQIKAQNEERERLAKERQQREQEERERVMEEPVHQPAYEPEPEPLVEAIEPEKTFKSSFTVYGTKEQFAMLKQFMQENNIKYEGVAR